MQAVTPATATGTTKPQTRVLAEPNNESADGIKPARRFSFLS